MQNFSRPASLRGTLAVPGDKSISHRALLLPALADGWTRVRGMSDGHDVAATRRALQVIGIAIEDRDGAVHVRGKPLQQWQPAGLRQAELVRLDCGNSGTTMRLLLGLCAAAQRLDVELVGDASLQRRPMLRVVEPLRRMGAQVETSAAGGAPLRVRGCSLSGAEHVLPVASAQLKSALLLAGLHSEGTTQVTEPVLSRDHSERMLLAMGARMERRGLTVQVWPSSLQPLGDFQVPGDPSSAAFGAVAAVLHPRAELRLPGVCINPTRAGWMRVLQRMGGDVQIVSDQLLGGEAVGELLSRSSHLVATVIRADEVPSCVDELPILALAASAALGTSRFEGIEELRVKESDRLTAIEQLLGALGVTTRSAHGWLEIDGVGAPGHWSELQQAWQPGLDHRMAMTAAVAGMTGPHPVSVTGFATVASSWPGFVSQFQQLSA